MYFNGCRQLTDISAIGHGPKEMKERQHFEMNFNGCRPFADISAIGNGLWR